MPIIKPTDPRLYLVAEPVSDVNAQVWPHMPEILFCLNRAKFAIALSAPQIGVSLRFFAYRSPAMSYAINPEILDKSKEMELGREGCLSWPGKWAAVPRHKRIRARWTDERGVLYEKELTGVFAKVFQHEIDHLDGKNIFPRPEVKPPNPEETK